MEWFYHFLKHDIEIWTGLNKSPKSLSYASYFKYKTKCRLNFSKNQGVVHALNIYKKWTRYCKNVDSKNWWWSLPKCLFSNIRPKFLNSWNWSRTAMIEEEQWLSKQISAVIRFCMEFTSITLPRLQLDGFYGKTSVHFQRRYIIHLLLAPFTDTTRHCKCPYHWCTTRKWMVYARSSRGVDGQRSLLSSLGSQPHWFEGSFRPLPAVNAKFLASCTFLFQFTPEIILLYYIWIFVSKVRLDKALILSAICCTVDLKTPSPVSQMTVKALHCFKFFPFSLCSIHNHHCSACIEQMFIKTWPYLFQ